MTREHIVNVDAARIDMGWVVCHRDAWELIDTEMSLVWSLEQCSTWGEVRQLELSPDLLELVGETENAPDHWLGTWPADETPFAIDFSDSEWYDLNTWLGRAGLDFIESVGADILPQQMLVDDFSVADSMGGQMAYVYNERVDAVLAHFRQQGLDVRVHG